MVYDPVVNYKIIDDTQSKVQRFYFEIALKKEGVGNTSVSTAPSPVSFSSTHCSAATEKNAYKSRDPSQIHVCAM